MLGSNIRFPIFRFSIFLGGCCFLLFLSGCASFHVEGEMQAGRRALQSEEPKVALPHFQRAAELDTDYLTLSPLDQGVWTYVGRAYYGMGKLPEARKALERARSRYEHDHVARLYLGLVLAQSGERQRGLREAEASVWAQDKAATSLRSRSHLFARGVQELGLSVGWGVASPVGPQNGQIEDLQFINVSPRWGIGITDPLGGSAWYHGNFEFLAEGTYLREFEPIHGHSVGITALVRYNFIRDGKVIPFAEIGAGIHSLNFDLKGQEDGLNFSGQGGFGLHYFISEQTAVTAGWRFVHISNGSNGNNLGLNDSVILIGISTFFP